MKVKLGTGPDGDFNVDIAKLLESRLLIQANSGGGKSWAIRRLLESTHGKVQQIVLDREGEFKTLREKYDYILAGEGGDIPVETRHAPLLVRKILELRTSLIVDLYELKAKERPLYVKAFLEAMVNAPKKLWHPVLVLLDEAHIFAPESGKGKAVSLEAVIELESLGRKRGFCLIPATQRLAKLNKDVAAECNNKLIGRTGLDTDVKRVMDELGFPSYKEALVRMRLEKGNFYAYGPAFGFSNVQKIKIGPVKTTHPRPGHRMLIKNPAPTARVKKVLSQMADIPKEAEKEIQDMAQALAEIQSLKAQVRTAEHRPAGASPEEIRKAQKKGFDQGREQGLAEEATRFSQDRIKVMTTLKRAMTEAFETYIQNEKKRPKPKASKVVEPVIRSEPPQPRPRIDWPEELRKEAEELKGQLGRCERAILGFLISYPDREFSKAQVAVMSGYSQNSSGFGNAIAKLNTMELIERRSGKLIATAEASSVPGVSPNAGSLESWIGRLSKCERAIFQVLMDSGEEMGKDQVAEMTNYSTKSSGFGNSLSKLTTLGLIKRPGPGTLILNPEISEL